MTKTILIAMIAALSTACGMLPGSNANTATNANAANAATNSKVNTSNVNTAGANANTADANAKTANTGPKRIEFKKGEYSGTESVTLAAGASATFIVGAANDQKIYIESSDASGKIKITGGKVAELSNEKGYFDGITKAKGDITFTLTNPGKSEMKTKLSVTLVENGD